MDTVEKIGHGISVLFTGIIGVAILAIVLSSGSNTATILQSFFSGLTSLITAVITPVSGGSNVLGSSSTNSGSIIPGLGNLTSSSGAGGLIGGLGSIVGGSGGSSSPLSGILSNTGQLNVNSLGEYAGLFSEFGV